ncbi:S41 family peptidase [Granulosicoccaceae sp. 1_MG-2023]|nr:S41 family peptidase [Granulosicoccaceae sp. 1_MG-2023]
MHKHFLPRTLFITLLALSACSSDQGSFSDNATAATGSCDADERNSLIFDAMREDYLWYEQVPLLDYTSYSDPAALLADLRYAEYDRFSYLMDLDDYEASQQNRMTAFGFSLMLWDSRYVFSFIQPGSPMDQAGVQRGDELLQIGDVPMSGIDDELFAALLDTSDGPKTQQLRIAARDSAEERTISVTSAEFDVTTVFNQHTRETAGTTTGYLGLSRFMSGSADELETAFAQQMQEGVTDLVVDLRYNGGGLIRVAAQLAGLIGGTAVADETFAQLVFNDRLSHYNTRYSFTDTDTGLGLQRVILLTGPATCSASEMIINGLSPFMDVVTIGDTTCGKPVGMVPETLCDKTLFAINFAITNGQNEGGYFDGLEASCTVTDLPTGDMWSEDDPLYAAALDYITQGQCINTRQSDKFIATQPLAPARPALPDWDLF